MSVIGQTTDKRGTYIYLNLRFSNGKKRHAVIDSGCDSYGVIDPSLVRELELESFLVDRKTRITLADGNTLSSSKCLLVPITAGNITHTVKLTVMPVSIKLIVGLPTLYAFDLINGLATRANQLNAELSKN